MYLRLTLYENHTYPAMCPILHFVAITFADNAFHPRLINAGLSPCSLHNFSIPDGRIIIDFTFKDDIFEIPIFRCSQRSIQGLRVDPKRALSANSISFWMKQLGQRAGFEYPLQPYALRRKVGTELKGLFYDLFHTPVPRDFSFLIIIFRPRCERSAA